MFSGTVRTRDRLRFGADDASGRSPRSASSSTARPSAARVGRRRADRQALGARRHPDRRRDRHVANDLGAPPLRPADAGNGRRPAPSRRQGRAARRARPARRAGPADQPAAGRPSPGDVRLALRRGAEGGHPGRRWRTTSASTSSSARRRRSASSGRSAPAPPSRSIDKAPNPFLATVGLRIEPAPIDSGVEFRLEVELGSMPLAFFKAVEDTVQETLRQGSTDGRSPTARSP